MPLAKREWSFHLLRHGLAAASLGLLLGFLGPFGTNPAFDRTERYAFWLGVTLTGYLFGFAAWKFLGSARLTIVLRVGLAALLSSLPQTFVAFWAMALLQPGRTASVGGLLLLFFAVAVVQLMLITAITLIDQSFPASPLTDEATRPPAAKAQLADAQLIALEAEDHYVRVHGMAGSRLVLQRLSDAIDDVGSVEGLQVHRGWWVARAAVTGTYVEGGRRWIRLANGLTVPVSRARRREVLAQGWQTL